MAANDVEVTVLTVFAGLAAPPFSATAMRLHEMWQLGNDPVSARREEDRRAMWLLGAKAVYGDFLDVIYRRFPDGSLVIGDDGSLARQEVENDLLAKIEHSIDDAIGEVRPDLVLTCAGIGGHLDHCLTRDAVVAATCVKKIGLRLWEDVPYSIWHGRQSAQPPAAVWWFPAAVEVIEISNEQAWLAKYQAVGSYVSQLRMLWPDFDYRDDLERHGKAWAAKRQRAGKGEGFWSIATAAYGKMSSSNSVRWPLW
jgi:LmbE family N-acetylglucosaminyl deacetylase